MKETNLNKLKEPTPRNQRKVQMSFLLDYDLAEYVDSLAIEAGRSRSRVLGAIVADHVAELKMKEGNR